MKNNKGYYSWIHAMNRAGVESQVKAQNMLTEATAKKVPFNADKFQASMPSGPVQHGKPDVDPNVIRAAAQVLSKEPTTPQSISLAGGDAGEYAKIRRAKHAEKLQSMSGRSTENYNHDLTPARTDVNMDSDIDGEDSAEQNSFKAAIETNTRPPSFPWAHQEDEGEMAERHAHMEAEYEANREAEHEGIEGIIDRMLRGKK
jgi:hypothetical protein